MAFNGAGVYSLYTPGNPVVTGSTISSTWANNTLNDIATALTTCILKDGTQTLTANIPMSNFKLTGLGAGSASTDSCQYGQAIKCKMGTTTHDVSVTGTQTISGLGFTPTQVIFISGVTGTSGMSVGADDGTNKIVLSDEYQFAPGTWYANAGNYCITGRIAAGANYYATISALASGQFTLTWTKAGAPTGTCVIGYIAYGV